MAGESKIFNYLRILLRPAVLLAVRNGLKVQDVFEALKAVFVGVAEEELRRSGESHSKSRLAVITGLQRRDISRLLDEDPADQRASSFLIKVIGLWANGKPYSRNKKPRPLSYEGTQSEFFSLVQAVSKDLNPYTVLFEMERIGAVEKVDDLIHLRMVGYEAREDAGEGWSLWSGDAENLIAAVEENLEVSKAGIPNLHITTAYDNVVRKDIPALREWILRKGAEFHAQVRAYVSKFDKDLNPALFAEEGGGKLVITSFSKVTEPPTAEKVADVDE